jgi:hypothetical protein
MVKIVPQIDVFLPFLGIGLSATGSLALSFLSVSQSNKLNISLKTSLLFVKFPLGGF